MCAANSRKLFTFRKTRCASSFLILVQVMAVSTPVNTRSKRRVWLARPASRLSSFGRAKKNSPGRYFRPAGVIDIKSGVKNDGTITAWEFHNYNSGASGIQIKYDIPNNDIRFHQSNSPLRQGSYRGLAATANHFARESHIDELANELKMDPLEFRLKNIKDERLRDVLQAAAKSFGWGKTKPANGHGFGIACGFEKGGYVATCAEIAIEPASTNEDKANKRVRLVRVVDSFRMRCGGQPASLKEPNRRLCGAWRLAGALFESIDFANGKILNPHFANYRVPRFSDMPLIEIVILDRKDIPSAGAGETPIVGLAPARGQRDFQRDGRAAAFAAAGAERAVILSLGEFEC